MNTEERALRMLAAANPIPDVDSLEPEPAAATYLATLEQRSSEVAILDTKPRERQGRRRSVTPWQVAAVATAIIAVAALLLVREDDTPVASDPVEIALSFIEARNGYDGTAMVDLLAPDAMIQGDLADEPSQYGVVADLERAVDIQYQVSECRDVSTGASLKVSCPYEMDVAWLGALGLEPVGTSSFVFFFADGKITNLLNNLNFRELIEAQDQFIAWVESNHPGDTKRMFRDEPAALPRPLLTSEAVELFERYTAEFVAALTEE